MISCLRESLCYLPICLHPTEIVINILYRSHVISCLRESLWYICRSAYTQTKSLLTFYIGSHVISCLRESSWKSWYWIFVKILFEVLRFSPTRGVAIFIHALAMLFIHLKNLRCSHSWSQTYSQYFRSHYRLHYCNFTYSFQTWLLQFTLSESQLPANQPTTTYSQLCCSCCH